MRDSREIALYVAAHSPDLILQLATRATEGVVERKTEIHERPPERAGQVTMALEAGGGHAFTVCVTTPDFKGKPHAAIAVSLLSSTLGAALPISVADRAA